MEETLKEKIDQLEKDHYHANANLDRVTNIANELAIALQNMLNRFAPYGSGDATERGNAIQRAEEAIKAWKPENK